MPYLNLSRIHTLTAFIRYFIFMSGTKADLHTNCWIRHSNTLRYVMYRDERDHLMTLVAKVQLYILRPSGSGVSNIFNFAVLVKRSNYAKRTIPLLFCEYFHNWQTRSTRRIGQVPEILQSMNITSAFRPSQRHMPRHMH